MKRHHEHVAMHGLSLEFHLKTHKIFAVNNEHGIIFLGFF